VSGLRGPRPRSIVLASAFALFSIGHLYAQTQQGVFEGGVEAGPLLFIGTGGHETIGGFLFAGEPHLEYFPTPEFAVGVTCLFYRSLGGNERPLFGAAYGHMNYFFTPSSRLSPYIGGRIGLFNADSEALFGFGPQMGLKYFITPWFSINGQFDGAIHLASEGTLFLLSLVLGLSFHV